MYKVQVVTDFCGKCADHISDVLITKNESKYIVLTILFNKHVHYINLFLFWICMWIVLIGNLSSGWPGATSAACGEKKG